MKAQDLLAGIRRWVEIESGFDDPDGVNRMINEVAGDYGAADFDLIRIPDREGRGDHLIARSPYGGDEPGILIVSHVTTSRPPDSQGKPAFRVEGDWALGPGICDMKGGAYLALQAAACGPVKLPVTHFFTSDPQAHGTASSDLLIQLANANLVVLVTKPAIDGGKFMTADHGMPRWDHETGLNRPSFDASPELSSLATHVKTLAGDLGWRLEETRTGISRLASLTSTLAPTLDGLGVEGEAAGTLDERLAINALEKRFQLMRRLLESLPDR